jgi:hypothetical protein
MTADFWKDGFVFRAGFLSDTECDRYGQSVRALERTGGLPLIERQAAGRWLRYKVVDGRRIDDVIPDIDELSERVQAELERICGIRLLPISDYVAARNVNITPPGGEYRWHYDRNAATAILYLNEVPGGETEMFPNYRLVFRGGRHQRVQRWLDGLLRLRPVRHLLGRRTLVAPRRGALLIMRGDRALHSVRTVGGSEDRINLILAYDVPGSACTRDTLNTYLYSDIPAMAGDPNYGA